MKHLKVRSEVIIDSSGRLIGRKLTDDRVLKPFDDDEVRQDEKPPEQVELLPLRDRLRGIPCMDGWIV